MPTITCPRCTVTAAVDDDRLARPFYCSDCGCCLCFPPPTVPFLPVEQLEEVPLSDPPPIQIPPIDITPPPRPRQPVAHIEPETPRRSLVPIVCAVLIVSGLAYATVIGILSVQASRAASPKQTKVKNSAPAIGKRSPRLTTPREPEPDPEPPPPRSSTATPPSPPPVVKLDLPPNGRPTAAKEGVTWTTDELTAYLQRGGLAFSVSERFGKPDDVWVVLRAGGQVQSVMITRHAKPADATASVKSDPGRSFAWGRFILWGEQTDFFRKVRAALAD